MRIYRFGGQGNDWCFVRLPVHYDPLGAPLPLVICNHGNGWTMDGSERMANFSGKTQYGVDLQRDGAYMDPLAPGYRRYSNPLIEALLQAGYIVCGAQNYGDGLYGNEFCVQACVDFYHHMLDHYHVDKKNAYMLGCSNGFMTTLNAVSRLGPDSVRALIGLYPLCNLRHAYAVTHTDGVRRAYGLDDGSSDGSVDGLDNHLDNDLNTDLNDDFNNTETATALHLPECMADYDPLSPERNYPPTLLIWSMSDQVLPMQEHAMKFIQHMHGRGVTVHSIQVDRDGSHCPHGHWRHFAVEQIMDWCRLNGGHLHRNAEAHPKDD